MLPLAGPHTGAWAAPRPSMVTRLLVALCLLPSLACGPDGPPAPIGSFELDREATEGFTGTRYKLEGSLTGDEVNALATRLVTGLSGTVRFKADGEGAVQVEGPNGPLASVTGRWTQDGRRVVLTGQESPSTRFEFDWIDGSRALRLELPVGEETAVLIFQAEPDSED